MPGSPLRSEKRPPRSQGPVEKAVRTELRNLKVSIVTSGCAALAVSLARQIDVARGAVSAAAAARELRGILADLASEMASKQPERDEIDELRSRRTGTAG